MTEDDPGYCDMNGWCYTYEEDAENADSYIKEIQELKRQNRGITILKQEAEQRSFCYEEEIKELKELKKLKEDVKYWKNFALFYWSGHQLGEEANSDSDVWREALEQVNENNDCDVEELTKKCMDV